MNLNDDDFLSIKDIGDILHISYDSALLLVKTEIPHCKVGRSFRVREIAFRKWFKEKEKKSLVSKL